ncbi:MAG: EAL domain-containing response regulator [Betaproteobacteria bacterium]
MDIADLRFLIAEDHEFQRQMLARMLATLGAKDIREASDGRAALKIIHDPDLPVDIVISDLDMPGMDGMEFIRHLGESKAGMSIILASALERELLESIATMTKAYGVRLLGVVEKPIVPGNLEALIRLHQPPPAAPREPKAASPVFTLEQVAEGLKNDQFEPFFQPKIELATGRVKGAEALARWRHPRHGLVAPYAFIRLIEESRLIDVLTWSMLKKSAACCSDWRAAGLDLSVSVNLSPSSLSDVGLADRIVKLVRGQNLDPQHMILEVTESAAAADTGKALENLSRLRMKGFGISIDDYGTGYSSMQQLTRIAFTELKIDQSFVLNASKQKSAAVILESNLEMARKLKVRAVAEGVETREDYALLQRLGCDLAQGYFIARPMEAAAFPAWVRDWKQMQ